MSSPLWRVLKTTEWIAGQWTVMTASTTVASFSYPENAIGAEARLISPVLDMSALGGAVLSFEYAMMALANYDELEACYRSSEQDEWHVLAMYSTSDWTNTFEAVLPLPNLSSTYQISFLARGLGGYYIFLDNIRVASAQNCIRPTDLEILENHPTDVLIGWTSYNGESSWILEVDGVNHTVNANPYRITSLSPQSNYTVRVKALCATDNESEWSSPISFTTACDVITVTDENPYTDDFESSEDFVCWTSEIISGIDNWVVDPGYLNPNNTAFFIWLGGEARLVSAPLDITSVTNPTLVFKHKQLQGMSSVDELAVQYRTAATEEWVMLANYPFPTEGGYETVSLALPNPSPTYQIAFKAKGHDAEGVYVDDVAVGTPAAIGIEETDAPSALVYPNPTTGNITVESNAINAELTVLDMFGKLMMTAKVASKYTDLDFSSFASGIYMIRIAGSNAITTVKVVKE
ncbi:MAG: T9SS type A sorting domain-containing protein [Bacteroidales bacterium]|nr:T9SS type A sorting domain-containing protein [Bacteroidales bacterium]